MLLDFRNLKLQAIFKDFLLKKRRVCTYILRKATFLRYADFYSRLSLRHFQGTPLFYYQRTTIKVVYNFVL